MAKPVKETEKKLFAGKPGPGRPKGVLNKNTVIAKDMIAQAAEQLGGLDRLVAWAQSNIKNESIFWGTIYPKLLPLQVTGEGGGAIVQRIELVGVLPK